MQNFDKTIEGLLNEKLEHLYSELLKNDTYKEWLRVKKLLEYHASLVSENGAYTSALVDITPTTEEEPETVVEDISEKTEISSPKQFFPLTGRRVRGRQVKFVVREAGKAISKNEIESRLEKHINQRINVREALKRAIRLGELTYVKFNNSQRYAFVALPEWIDVDGSGKVLLKRKYSPGVEELPKNLVYKRQSIEGMKKIKARLL